MKLLATLLLLASISEAQILTPQNTIIYFDDIVDSSNLQFIQAYAQHRQLSQTEPIYVVIRSSGGEFEAATQISRIVSTDPNLHAVVIFAASGAAALSQAVGGETYIVTKGQLMFHQVKLLAALPLSSEEMIKIGKELVPDNAAFAKICNRKMKLADYADRVKEDWWLNSAEAIKLKAAKPSKVKCSPEMIANNLYIPTFDTITGSSTPTNFCNLL